jgi:hypothetical protein
MATSSSGKVTSYQYEVACSKAAIFSQNRGFGIKIMRKTLNKAPRRRLRKRQQFNTFVKTTFYATEILS